MKPLCKVMGILNVTPDSFSDGGKWALLDNAFYHAEEMARDGADILDIGGESTRPGYTQISDEEELSRVIPVIEGISQRLSIPLSIDTYKSKVAEEAVKAGAVMVNDIWGLGYDEKMGEVIQKYQVDCCLMHNRREINDQDFHRDYFNDIHRILERAHKAGISKEKILLDPGVGFGKTPEMNLMVIHWLKELVDLGYPVLLGASRKGFIGKALNLPVDQRLEGTLAVTAWGCLAGVAYVRVHDVKENKRLIAMLTAIHAKAF